jgi:molybdopterin converting factor small subunit
MSITIKIPAGLRSFSKADAVQVEAASVKGAIAALDEKIPGIAGMICTEPGDPRPHILIYVDQVEIRELSGMDTPLRGNETVHIIAAVSGG